MEEFWKQKASCHWLKEGERNTSYFHTLVKKKRQKMHISSIEVDGQLINHPQQIRESAAKSFEKLFTGDGVNFNPDDLANFSPVIPDDEALKLGAPPGLDELKQTVFSMET